MKAGEFRDPEMAKILEEREKRHDRDRREREKERERSNRSRRFRGGTAHYSDYPSRSFDSGAYQTPGCSGFGSEYGGRGGNVRGGRRPGSDNKCHLCGEPGHFFKQCPQKETVVRNDNEHVELKASEWVMEVLKEGYVIPFIKHPPVYEEVNNASAIQELIFVQQEVADLERLKIIEFREERPHCGSPLTVSKSIGRDGSIKKR
ncbi:hypothetical protein DAPPUDRAFT_112153 [Daphnia pulex]|uniref:CCHC-type domain-containing protein n=1 Tax=Daphnia pulex TaxID=6669 RepID=E9HB22_DAPPU|nr:hypothetical protein DAPPUDRAFT_112153 [Daphnia pulex]|eukprot:EFX71043.1 hypothetical protein DAPPUDRAFT_112153 [Daphnia pulex]